MQSSLELVLDRQLQNSLRRRPGLVIQNTEVVRVRIWVGGYVGGKGLACIVGVVVQSHLALPAELGQRVVQPVECGNTELDSLSFCQLVMPQLALNEFLVPGEAMHLAGALQLAGFRVSLLPCGF